MLFSAGQEGVCTYCECARSMAIVWTYFLKQSHPQSDQTSFTYGISVWGVSSHDKYLSKIDKFQERAVRFGFLKEAMPILSLVEASDNKLWKSVTNSTEGPLTDLLPPSKTRLLRNHGHSYVLLQIRTESFKCCFINRCLFNFI